MALIVEDGTGMPTAQSAVSAADVRTWAGLRGISVPAVGAPGDLEIEQALIKGMDYLQSNEFCYRGQLKVADQGIPFPRSNFYYQDGTALADDVVPNNFKVAQIRLSIEVLNGVDLMPTLSGNPLDYVIKEKVGPLETEYADPTKFNGRATITAVESLLAPLTGGDCCPPVGFLQVYRV